MCPRASIGLDLGVMIVEVEGDVLPVIKKLQKERG
ncbi:hypothetical protein Golob_016802 [Gossypium lobatum]|uniref:Uncharacterized protein n=1 Tax=Gossypium lobatum TaxID=34289 RepID=A0A7J8M552_9ROSI|nr:hypothetical protein [Gossypium lobatum]